jgi:pentatricopeptide repeat protein
MSLLQCIANSVSTMHGEFSREMPARDLISWNTMMAGYFQHGRLMDAHCLFHGMPEKDVVSWTGMIAGYTQNGHSEEALKLFLKMKQQGINPNRSTFASVLSACASIAALEQGKQIHDHILKTEYSSDVVVGNALVTMYSKCGRINVAYQVFGQMTEQDVVSWTAIITGFAQHGSGKKALELFDRMQQVGIKPNHVTFVGVLTACSHSCLLDEGWQHFYSMTRDYGITPGVDHYACMVDLLGRMGLMTEAEDFIKNMPLQPDPVVWKALLGACAVHRNLEVGERVAKELFKLEPQNSAAYVLLSNIYATTGRWDDVTKVRFMMKNIGVQKEAGCSWIEIKNKVHAFIVGDRSHP